METIEIKTNQLTFNVSPDVAAAIQVWNEADRLIEKICKHHIENMAIELDREIMSECQT